MRIDQGIAHLVEYNGELVTSEIMTARMPIPFILLERWPSPRPGGHLDHLHVSETS